MFWRDMALKKERKNLLALIGGQMTKQSPSHSKVFFTDFSDAYKFKQAFITSS